MVSRIDTRGARQVRSPSTAPAGDDVERANQALRESEERYRMLFESIDEGFCVIEVLFDDADQSADYRFLEVNPAFERQTGIVNAVGRRMREIAPAHEQHWFDIYGRVALTGEPMRFENQAAALNRWYDVYAFRVGQPRERRVAILFNDITQRKQAEQELARQRENLELLVEQRTAELKNSHQRTLLNERMAAVGSLAAGLAHDMNNVLLPLGARLEMLLTSKTINPEVKNEIAPISALVDHLRQMSKNLSLFSRDPEKEGTVGQTELSAWCGAVCSLMEASVRGAPGSPGRLIRVNAEVSQGLPVVAIAPHRLTQAVLNLVLNSRDAILAKNQTGSGSITIQARRAEIDGEPGVMLKVIDDGFGMDEATKQQSPELFFTTKHRTDVPGGGGSGLGLALVYAIMQRAGGRMEIESEPGQGTTVTLLLPGAAAPAAPKS